MTKVIWGGLAGLILGVAVAWGVLTHRGSEAAKDKPEEHSEPARVVHTNGQTLVRLDVESQEHARLQVAELAAGSFKPELKSYGHVLEPSPLAVLVAEIASAAAALEASSKELQRLKLLHSQGQNVSARTLEAAEAVTKRDQITLDVAQSKLLSGWGKGVASQPDLPAFVRSLTALETALVRVDLPLGEALRQPPLGARIAAVTVADGPTEATFVGPVPVADPQTQGQGFLFLLRGTPLPPGTAVDGWLALPGESRAGVIVPRSALVRHEGRAFVYLQVGEQFFERKEVALEHPLQDGWFVDAPLKPNQKIVVTGAQQLLSEELRGEGGEAE